MSHDRFQRVRARRGSRRLTPAVPALIALACLLPLAAVAQDQTQRTGAEPPRALGTMTAPREAPAGSLVPGPDDHLRLPGMVERTTTVVRESGVSCVADLVCVSSEPRGDYLAVVAELTAPLVATAFVDIDAGALPDAPERVQALLDGEGRHVLVRLGPIPPEYRLSTSVRARLGAVGGSPDATVYHLPFAPGTARKVSWVGAGPAAAERGFAQWIAAPGTQVLAARAGVVGAIRTQTQQAGLIDFPAGLGNLVAVSHDDGTVGIYGRLDFRGVQVNVGQRVQPGDVIGTSGLTGMGPNPAVSFTVVTPVGPDAGVRVWPVQFQTAGGTQSPAVGAEMRR